jgi:hypothetical protein
MATIHTAKPATILFLNITVSFHLKKFNEPRPLNSKWPGKDFGYIKKSHLLINAPGLARNTVKRSNSLLFSLMSGNRYPFYTPANIPKAKDA